MHDDQKDQELLCANESIEVVLRLNTAAVCRFSKQDNNLKRLCVTTAGNKPKSLRLERCCLPRPCTTFSFCSD